MIVQIFFVLLQIIGLCESITMNNTQLIMMTEIICLYKNTDVSLVSLDHKALPFTKKLVKSISKECHIKVASKNHKDLLKVMMVQNGIHAYISMLKYAKRALIFYSQDIPKSFVPDVSQDILFISMETFDIHEIYQMNGFSVSRQIFNIHQPYYHERRDFYGKQITAITESEPPYIYIDLERAKFDSSLQMYDVTESVSGYFHGIFIELQNTFNFSAKFVKRQKYEWGNVIHFKNGTKTVTGIVDSVVNRNVDFICAR